MSKFIEAVNATLDPQLMAERLESLKAGIVGGFSLFSTFAVASLLNTLLLAKYFHTLASLQRDVNWHLLVSVAIATFTGLLFGLMMPATLQLSTDRLKPKIKLNTI